MKSMTPVLDATVERMASLALTTGEALPPDLTPDAAATAYLLAYTENGGRLSQLAKDLGVSRFLLQRWIWGNAERKQSYAHARTLGADAQVDEGGDILDRATRDTIAVDNARAQWRKWYAGKVDPQGWGEGTQGGMSIGSLHLHAALTRPPLQSQSPPLLGAPPGAGEGGYPTAHEIVVEPVKE